MAWSCFGATQHGILEPKHCEGGVHIGEWPSMENQSLCGVRRKPIWGREWFTLAKEGIPAEGQLSKGCQNPYRVRMVFMSSRRGKCSCIALPGIKCQSLISERRVSTCGEVHL